MLKVSFREPRRDQRLDILVDEPPVVSEAVALLWVLQYFENRDGAVHVDWTADLATLRQQIESIGVADITWETV